MSIEPPLVRPGTVDPSAPTPRVVARFPNAAEGNLAIQLLGQLGVPASKLGVTSPDRMPGQQGMILSIPCENAERVARVEALCRDLGADCHRQRP